MNKKFIAILSGIVMVMATGCDSNEPAIGSNDDLNNGNKVVTGYIGFKIKTDPTTRAVGEEYSNGDENEYALSQNANAHVVYYYNEDGSFFGYSNLTAVFEDDGNDHATIHPEGYPEEFYAALVQPDGVTKDVRPAQMMVILNLDPQQQAQFYDKTIDEARAIILSSDDYNTAGIYSAGGTRYFTMSSSTFLNEAGNDATAIAIEESDFYATPQEAMNHKVTVYVERLMSKVTTTFANNSLAKGTLTYLPVNAGVNKAYYVADYTGESNNYDESDYLSIEEVEWDVYIVNWGLNAYESDSYAYKNLGSSTASFFTDWNDNNYHRSYWSVAPHYNESVAAALNLTWAFPYQYRSAQFDLENSNVTSATPGTVYDAAGIGNQNTSLNYLSFNDMNAIAPHKYALENTFDDVDARTGFGPYRHATHVLLAAQLVFSNEKANLQSANADNTLNASDKWYAYGIFWGNEASYIRYAYNRMVNSFADGRTHTVTTLPSKTASTLSANGSCLYVKDGEQYTKISTKDAPNYFTTAPAYVEHGDGKRTLRLKEGVTLYYEDYRFDENTQTGTSEMKPLTTEQVNGIVYAFTDYAHHFNNGRMYYAIPIQHKLGKSAGRMVELDKYNETPYAIGQFGVVRNHWYKLNVQTVGSWGVSVDDPDQPIIPNLEDEYNIALELVIIPWKVIDNGNVDL